MGCSDGWALLRKFPVGTTVIYLFIIYFFLKLQYWRKYTKYNEYIDNKYNIEKNWLNTILARRY